MKIPYNQVHTRGQILFAARGGKIHTFSLINGDHITTWKHPDVEKVDDVVKSNAKVELESRISQGTVTEPAAKNDGPPAKRQKLAGDSDNTATATAAESEESVPAPVQDESKKPGHVDGRGRKGNSKGGKETGPRYARVPDRPVITHLASTEDGKYLLAITGHDKIIWVFEHDGSGHLKELSHRTMPKRPSSVAIAPDSWIVCADKFGDVYSLPLIMSDDHKPSTPLSSLPLPTKKAFKPSANTFTVHSKGNRKALLNQIKQAELGSQSKETPDEKPDGPTFELNLLLGHVSMLTTLTLGEVEGRKYIITADRDEHIRVSRYMPNAHVIENFCFGHKEFINAMTIPPTKPDVLISGGGDDHLFIWDWVAGKLLSQASILSLAKEILPDLTKVAVSSLQTMIYPSDDGALIYILAICEDINAIFSWHLSNDNQLNRPSIIQLPGKPLSLAVFQPAEKTAPTLITALDPNTESKARSLHVFSLSMNNGRLAVDNESSIKDDALELDETDIAAEEVRSLLYSVESLRKLAGNGQDGEAGSEIPQVDVVSVITAETINAEA